MIQFSLIDPQTDQEIISYRISQILFCARGPSNTPLACCWAFTTSRATVSTTTNEQTGEQTKVQQQQQELLYQCQVFRCTNQETIYKVLLSFANAFRRPSPNSAIPTQVATPHQQSSSSFSRRTTSLIGQAFQATKAQLQQQTSNTSQSSSNHQQQTLQRPSDAPIKFRAYFDIKEETIDSKGNPSLNSVPRPEKNVFRLRKDVRKNVSVTLQQIRGYPLNIERCFGMLLAQGRNVRACDMQLLDLVRILYLFSIE